MYFRVKRVWMGKAIEITNGMFANLDKNGYCVLYCIDNLISIILYIKGIPLVHMCIIYIIIFIACNNNKKTFHTQKMIKYTC